MENIKELIDIGLTAIIESGKVNGVLYNKFIDVYNSNFPNRPFNPGCGSCLDDAFYYIQTFYNKQLNPMETIQTNSEFHIKGDGTIYNEALHKHISNRNLTDDLAYSLLARSENYERSFDKMPKDWKDKLEDWKKEQTKKMSAKKSGSNSEASIAKEETKVEKAAEAETKAAETEAKKTADTTKEKSKSTGK